MAVFARNLRIVDCDLIPNDGRIETMKSNPPIKTNRFFEGNKYRYKIMTK